MPSGQQYATNVPQTTLTSGGVTSGATSCVVASSAGWPSTPFCAVFDIGTTTQEPVQVTNVTGTTWTIVRGLDGTTSFSHSAGATVTHSAIGRDFREFRAHLDATGSNDSTGYNVHGLGVSSNVVGTTDVQTLTNKTIAAVSSSASTVPIISKGSLGQTADLFDVQDSSGNNRFRITNNGAFVVAPGADVTALYIQPQNNTTSATVNITDGGGNPRVQVTSNGATGSGAVAVTPSDTGTTSLLVNAPSGTTSNVFDAQINGTSKWKVSSSGNLVSTGTATALDLTAMTGAIPVIGPTLVSYSPALGGSGSPSLGNGTLTGGYVKYGRQVFVEIILTIGSTTTLGTSQPNISLPLPASNYVNLDGWITHSSNVWFAKGFEVSTSSSTFRVGYIVNGTTGQLGVISNTTPFTFANGDILFFKGTYQATT